MKGNTKYKKRRDRKVISNIAYVLFILGCAGVESENRAIPVAMILVGLAILVATVIKENSFTPSRPK